MLQARGGNGSYLHRKANLAYTRNSNAYIDNNNDFECISLTNYQLFKKNEFADSKIMTKTGFSLLYTAPTEHLSLFY